MAKAQDTLNKLTIALPLGRIILNRDNIGLEPTTALSTEFTVRGDTNYAVLTYIGTGGWIRTNEYRSLVVNNRFELLSSFWM